MSIDEGDSSRDEGDSSRDEGQCTASSSVAPLPATDYIDIATISNRETLSDERRYLILTKRDLPHRNYPTNSQNRRFQRGWVEQYEWIRYSVSVDGIFCGPCFLFSNCPAHSNTEFSKTPFKDWKNASGGCRGALNRHAVSQTHLQCVDRAVSFIAVREKKQPSVVSLLDRSYDSQAEKNTRALLAIIDSTQFLIKQGLALRGHSWYKDINRESGNFSTLIDFVANYSPDLKQHLQHSARNAKYLSPKIQNDFISINSECIRKAIVEECNASMFWSLMVDEATDVSTVEQVSVCVRYIKVLSDELEVCEEFLGFTSVASTTAETITSALVDFMTECGLDRAKFIGKGFDGAANMSGHISGVSERLRQIYPHAKYFTHCRNHALNLVIVASCNKVPDIRNFMSSFKELTLFFSYSAKRKHILKTCLRDGEDSNLLADTLEEDEQRTVPDRHYRGLPVLSDTRWLTRVDSIDCLLKNFKSVCKAVEEVRNLSTGQSANDAESFLKRLLSFEFITAAVICYHVLAYTRPLTVALQAKNCDLLKAHFMAQRLIKTLQGERAENKFLSLWKRIVDISVSLGIEPSRRRTVTVQRHRANPPVNSDSEGDMIAAHYRIAYYNAFLDHVISHLSSRFPQELHGALLASYLTPGRIKDLTTERIQSIKEEYQGVLPLPSVFENEVNTWKIHVSEFDTADVSLRDELRLATTLAENHNQYYPNIRAILMLLISLPVGSCSCERSFSSLKRLKSWCRNSMCNKRLDSLSVGFINQDRTPTPHAVLRIWDQSGNRRIPLSHNIM